MLKQGPEFHFEISEVDITRVDCSLINLVKLLSAILRVVHFHIYCSIDSVKLQFCELSVVPLCVVIVSTLSLLLTMAQKYYTS